MNASKLNTWVGCGLGVLLLTGCGMFKKKQSDAAPSATVAVLVPPPPAVTPVTPVTPAPAPDTVADEAVPAPEDFEDEAFEKVSDKTYKAEFDVLKNEIDPR